MSQNIQAMTFDVYQGSALIKTVTLEEQSITIGSGAVALLPIEGSNLADLHAVINVEDDGSVYLLDLVGDGRVLYGGQPTANTVISSGDSFEIGDLKFVFTIGGQVADDVTEEQPVAAAPAAAVSSQEFSNTSQSDAIDAEEARLAEVSEDVMSFIMRSGTSNSSVGVDKKRRKVLEVNQLWGETLVDTKHFSRTMGHSVTIGSAVGWRWNFLGVDMGWIPSPLHMILPYAPPMWSEVNSDWRDDFYAPDDGLSGRDHVMFELVDEEYHAKILDHWDGFVDIGEKRYTFDEMVEAGKAKKEGKVYVIQMDDDVRLMVDADGQIFFCHMVYEGTRILARNTEEIDYPFIAIVAFMGFLGMLVMVAVWLRGGNSDIEMAEIPERFAEVRLEQLEPEPEVKKKDKPLADPDAGEGKKAKKEEGKVGDKKSKTKKAKGDKKQVNQQQLDREVAENAGLLGALNDAGSMDSMFGGAGLNANLTGGVGGLIGAKGTQFGSGGLAGRGGGLGGGGSADGMGGMGTRGNGSGASGYGKGRGHAGEKGTGGIGRVGGPPIILGSLDRSLIDEVIKRHMSAIRYCYQRELTKNPSLGGKIVIKFTISKDGKVSSASKKSSTMNNASVEGCIRSRFMRMKFPQPKGGGIVIVSYPFLFSPG